MLNSKQTRESRTWAALDSRQLLWAERGVTCLPVDSQTDFDVMHSCRWCDRNHRSRSSDIWNDSVDSTCSIVCNVVQWQTRNQITLPQTASTITSMHPRSLHKTMGDRAFPVAAPRVWNMLPPAITSLPSLQTLKRALKTGTVSQIVRQRTLAATAALTLA